MDSSKALGLLPPSLRTELLDTFNNIVTNFRERRWEPSELNGGKLSEIVYTILKGYADGVFPLKSDKPRNMVSACQQLESLNPSLPRSLRIQIPRILIALYEIRNSRGVSHVGGEVNSNLMDATIVLYLAKWLISELVRVFHNLDTDTATAVVESLMEREVPIIWEINGKKRVLKNKITMKEKVLLLLYSQMNVTLKDLLSWTEHQNATVFKRDILIPGHKNRLWEYDKESFKLSISPLGIKYVENKLL